MSAHAGVHHFGGTEVAPEELSHWLTQSLKAAGPDDGNEYSEPGLLMVYRALHITHEDRCERQPFISPQGFVMTWDGRLDNREDLIAQFWRHLSGNTTDVALASAAYARWGVDGFARLIGDWSLALWDRTARTITLASDYMGARPLYYYANSHAVAWSSDLSLLAHECVDAQFVIGFLTFLVPRDSTPYRDVKSVTPACALTWTSGSLCRKRFWDFQPQCIRYSTLKQYEEQLRHVFESGIQARMRSTAPVFATLSGGLDSSTVVGAAHLLVTSGRVTAPRLQTVSYISTRGAAMDELPFIRCMEDWIGGGAGHHVSVEDSLGMMDESVAWITPRAPQDVYFEILNTVSRNGARVLLTGHAGDTVMGNHVLYPIAVAVEIAAMRPVAAIRAIRSWSLASQHTVWATAAAALAHLLPPSVQARRYVTTLLARHGATPSLDDCARLFLLRKPHVSAWLANLTDYYIPVAQFPAIGSRGILDALRLYSHGRQLQTAMYNGVLETHPYTHRPLVDFVMGIPPDVLCPPGAPRALMRSALADLLPPRILNRFSKGRSISFQMKEARTVANRWLDRIDRLHLVQQDYIDPVLLRNRLQDIRNGSCTQITNMPMLIRAERWLELRARATQHSPLMLALKGGERTWSTQSLNWAT